MGAWYAVEIVEYNNTVANTVSIVMNVCPILQLTRQDNMIILQWNENRNVLIYKFLPPKPISPGIWETAGHQDGETQTSIAINWVTCQFLTGEIFETEGTANHYYVVGSISFRPDQL